MLISTLEIDAKIFIYHGTAEDGQEIWFRNVFNINEIPDSAMLNLSTDGQILAYINGRIVGTQSIWPNRKIVDNATMQRQKGVATQSVNVRHLLRTGRNVIAIWYAPCIDVKALTERYDSKSCDITGNSVALTTGSGAITSSNARAITTGSGAITSSNSSAIAVNSGSITPDITVTLPDTSDVIPVLNAVIPGSKFQLSAEITIKTKTEKKDILTPRTNWLCKIAPASLTPYGENIDASIYSSSWKNTVLNIKPDWIRPNMSWYQPAIWNTVEPEGGYARNTLRAKLNVTNDSTQIYYFPYEETGQLRITIRNAKKGQELNINGMTYICTGETDEQFFTRFTTVKTDKVTVSNIGKQKFPSIQNIEMIILKKI